jgi:hypothetical protein
MEIAGAERDTTVPIYPYRETIKDLHRKRSLHAKGSSSNTFHKLMLNSIYGQVAMGLNGKTRKGITSFVSSKSTDPIIASICTGMVRAVQVEQIYYA